MLAAEKIVNSPTFKERFPEAGEDVKVMAVRTGRSLELTLAVAFVDRFVESVRGYGESKAAMRERLLEEMRSGGRRSPRYGQVGVEITTCGRTANRKPVLQSCPPSAQTEAFGHVVEVASVHPQ